MLQVKNVFKQYKTGSLVQMALNDVSVNLRDNEFISILGPSGSGKTTLLNIIGGLDRYDQGDLIIDGISTQKYNDRAWDSYRNHTIGFVFQSYNLIPHQNVLANVELALTIGGVKKTERRKRAEEALREVGLEEHMHKKPNQLSGGQMQRVAIARALVNNPKILLADEPTGALDSETGIQVMEILKKVAEKRLVVMVTHNPELAEKYSTRIVKLRDGKIIDDSNPYIPEETITNQDIKSVTMGKSKMSFGTSLALSFNNLKTKKGRTILTAFAGSIGIIGIALILALSNGVNQYVVDLQKDTIASYPMTIEAVTYDYGTTDFSSMFTFQEDTADTPSIEVENGIKVGNKEHYWGSSEDWEPVTKKNNLKAFKEYIEKPDSEFKEYVGTGSVNYVYYTYFNTYTLNEKNKYINIGSSLDYETGELSEAYDGYSRCTELSRGTDDELISKKVKNSYHIIYGDWPKNENEAVLVTDFMGYLDPELLRQLGYITAEDYIKIWNSKPGDNLNLITEKLKSENLCGKTLKLLPQASRYQKNADGSFQFIDSTSDQLEKLIRNSDIELKIVGIVCVNEGESGSLFENSIAYSYKTTNKIIDATLATEVIKAQLADPDINILTGFRFEETDEKKISDAMRAEMKIFNDYIKANAYRSYIKIKKDEPSTSELIDYDDAAAAAAFDKWLENIDNKTLKEIYDKLEIKTTYEDNLANFGYVSYDQPDAIVIYPDTFEGKQGIKKLIEEYNAQASVNDEIKYQDFIEDITSQITEMINMISYVLIAFVAVSLIVSCIMIGIITHISVLERTKEIGILRALGASKANISEVFNAETFIIGMLAGVLGIAFASLLTIPMNMVISSFIQEGSLNASVPIHSALILIAISILITVIGGLIPANKASHKDPVIALRTE